MEPKYPHIVVEVPIGGISAYDLIVQVETAMHRDGADRSTISRFLSEMSQSGGSDNDLGPLLATVTKWVTIREKRFDKPRILIEFYGGGDWDGKTLDSHSSDPREAQIAFHYYDFTRNGEIGRAFHGVSMGQFERMVRGEITSSDLKFEPGKSHKYTVMERLDEGDEVLVRIKYSVRDANKGKETES